MEIDQSIINWILAALGAAIGFVIRAIWQAIRELQNSERRMTDRLHSVQVLVAGEYVKQDEFLRHSEAMFKKLDRIENRVRGPD